MWKKAAATIGAASASVKPAREQGYAARFDREPACGIRSQSNAEALRLV